MGKYNRTFKMLDVVAERQVQVVAEKMSQLPMPAVEMLDPIVTVVFERAILVPDKIVIQGRFRVNKIFKAVNGSSAADDTESNGYAVAQPGNVMHFTDVIPFTAAVDLPGFNPTTTIGRSNRVVAHNTVLDIGPGNQATANGLDLQLFIKSLTPVQILMNNNTMVEQKMILHFFIKVSKFEQVTLELPAPNRVFEFRNVIDC